MRIRTQLTILMLIFGATLIVIVASAVVTIAQVTDAVQQGKLADAISDGASELGYLSNDYMIYREPQQRARWLDRYAAMSQGVAGLRATDAEEQSLILNVEDSARRIKEVFDSLDPAGSTSLAGSTGRTAVSAIDLAQLQVAWSRMGVQTLGLITDAGRLAAYEQVQVDRALALRTVLTYATIGIFGVFFLLGYLTMQRRILHGLETLRDGAMVIGAGDLDYRIPVERGNPGAGPTDEIGELSAAFNSMAANLKENEGQLQSYARLLVDASENERRTIARELHDETGQVMTALKMSLSRMSRRKDLPEGMPRQLEETKELADRVIDELRAISANLRPGALDQFGLVSGLEQHVEQFSVRTGLNVRISAAGFSEGGPDGRLAPEMETNLYRIAQEALTNAARYAQASHIDISLERKEREVVLVVQDDGCGFVVEDGLKKGHLGLLGMRERAEALNGRLDIESAPGKGALIRVAAPVKYEQSG